MTPAEKALQGLVGFAVTCRRSNTDEWMRLFAKRINTALKAVGDPDRVEFNGDSFWIKRHTDVAAGADRQG